MDVELGGRRDVAAPVRRAAHQHQLGDAGGDLGRHDEGGRDIGQRPESAQGDAGGFGVAQCLDQPQDAMLGPHRLGRLRQDEIAETTGAMRPLGIQPVRADRPRAAGIDADVGAAGQFDEGAGVARSRGERHVAGDRHQAQHLELGRGQCQQDGDGVVDAGIGVDDDRARHG